MPGSNQSAPPQPSEEFEISRATRFLEKIPFRIDSAANGTVENLSVYLTDEQYAKFIKTFGHNQRGTDVKTSCYTMILQHNLSRFNYGKMIEAESNPNPNFLERMYERVIKVSKSIFNFYSDENEQQVIDLMDTFRLCSEELAELEALVNNPILDTDFHSAIDQLKTKIENSTQKITNILDQHISNYGNSTIIENLKDNLHKSKILFLANIESQKQILSDENPLTLIFSLQQRRSETEALGTFISDQLIHLCAAGIDKIHQIGGGRARHLHHTHAAIKLLSNTKSEIDARAHSLHDVAINNDRSPYSKEMIDEIKPSTESDSASSRWIKVTDFIDTGLNNLKEIDRIICFLTGAPIHNVNTHKYEFPLKIALILSNFTELFIYTPIHLIFTTLSVFLGTIFYIAPLLLVSSLYIASSLITDVLSFVFNTDPLRNFIDSTWEKGKQLPERIRDYFNIQAIDQFAKTWHHQLSIVRRTRKTLDDSYQRNEQSDHTEILNKIKGHRISFYNDLLSQYSGEFFTKKLADTFIGFVDSVANIPREILYILQPKDAIKRKAVFLNRKEYIKTLQENINTEITKLKNKINPEYNEEKMAAGNSIVPASEVKETSSPQIKNNLYRPLVVPHPMNTIPSVAEIPREMIIGFNRGIVDTAFRNNSGSATLFFVHSLTTLGALAAPEIVKLEKLRQLCGGINHLFGINVLESDMLKKIMGVTQQWQVLYASLEATKGVLLGETEKLKWLLNNSEKITLFCLCAYSAGQLLKYLPQLPTNVIPDAANHLHDVINLVFPNKNFASITYNNGLSYAAGFLNTFPLFINQFKDESIEVGKTGTHPFKDFEQAIFGIKFLLIVHSLLSQGNHSSDHDVDFHRIESELAQLTKNLDDIKISKADKNYLLYAFLVENKMSKIAESVSHRSKLNETKIIIPHDDSNYSAFNKAREELYNAISQPAEYTKIKTLNQALNPENSQNDPHSGKLRNKLYFDYLVETFKKYNTEAKSHLVLDEDLYQRDYLHSYFAKNCYDGTNTITRLVTLALLYPVCIVYRELKRGLAKTEWFYSPSIEYQVQMDYAADKALFFQILGLLAVIVKTVARPLGYLGRIGLFGLSCPVALVAMLCGFKPDLNRWVDIISSSIVPHRFDGTSWLRPKYAEIARVASIDSDDLNNNTRRLLNKLEGDIAALERRKKTENNNGGPSYVGILTTLEEYKKLNSSLFFPNPQIVNQVTVLEKIISSDLNHNIKEKQVTEIISPLATTHPLRQLFKRS